MQKPDGLVVIAPDDVADVLEELPVQEICGIGPNLTRNLASLGILTCGQLGRAPLRQLTARFGVVGERLQSMGRGMDDDPVMAQADQAAEDSKSMGHSMTLDEDCADRFVLERHLLQLSEKTGRRLRRGLYSGRTVTVTVRYTDFHTFSRQRRLHHPVNHGLDIYAAASGILRELPLEHPVRLIGVSVANLERDVLQIPLFNHDHKRRCTAEAMDEINDRYGSFTVTWGSLIQRNRHERIISPAWRPTGDRQY
jgi:DNA polymerase-4